MKQPKPIFIDKYKTRVKNFGKPLEDEYPSVKDTKTKPKPLAEYLREFDEEFYVEMLPYGKEVFSGGDEIMADEVKAFITKMYKELTVNK